MGWWCRAMAHGPWVAFFRRFAARVVATFADEEGPSHSPLDTDRYAGDALLNSVLSKIPTSGKVGRKWGTRSVPVLGIASSSFSVFACVWVARKFQLED